MTANARTLKVIRPRSAEAFPAIEISAAAPARWTGEGLELAADLTAEEARAWARMLSDELAGRAWAATAVDAGGEAWTHHLRLQTDEGALRDFLVVARGLPADEAETRAHGYDYAELQVVAATTAPAPELN